jgi:hypothetical protein
MRPAPYEEQETPEIVPDNGLLSVETCINRAIEHLFQNGFINKPDENPPVCGLS